MSWNLARFFKAIGVRPLKFPATVCSFAKCWNIVLHLAQSSVCIVSFQGVLQELNMVVQSWVELSGPVANSLWLVLSTCREIFFGVRNRGEEIFCTPTKLMQNQDFRETGLWNSSEKAHGRRIGLFL